MRPPSDELTNLWNSEPSQRKCDTAELLRQLERTSHAFDRAIQFRDLRETAAGVLVSAIFLWLALHNRLWLERAAHIWLAVCGAWIAYYFRRYAKISRTPAPEQTLLAYQRELMDRYDRQIRLLKSAKYWYILPLWAGLLLSAFALLQRTGSLAHFGLMVAGVTLVNASLWWLNEVVAVRHLQHRRRALLALTEDVGCSK